MDKRVIILFLLVIILGCAIFVFTSINTPSSISGDLTYNDTDKADTNAILISNQNLSLSNLNVSKTGDSSRNSEDSDFYGTNAAVLVQSEGNLKLTNSFIGSNAIGANGIFVTNGNENGVGAEASLSNIEISTFKDKSRGLDATFGGIINGDNIVINTRGGSCAALATDRGEGIVNVTNSILNTGVDKSRDIAGSPIIYSTGEIIVKESSGTAHQSQIACIEGKNSIDLNNCDFTCSGKGNREDNGEYVDLGGFFIYQSMSGDADIGTASLNAKNSDFTIDSSSQYYSEAPMFHITNTNANINLENCNLNFGSNILIDVSSQNQWGHVGSNGGSLNFTCQNEKLEGNIIVDSISSLSFNFKFTSFSGAINPNGSFGNTNIIIGSDSTWTLTEDSYVTSLVNNGNINYAGHTLYVNGVAYSESNQFP